jgi:hypothetical protein
MPAMRRQVRARKQTSRSPAVLVRREQIPAATGQAVHAVWRGHVRLCSWVRCVIFRARSEALYTL